MRAFMMEDFLGVDTPAELTGVEFETCNKAMFGQGIVVFTMRDKEMADYDTHLDRMWQRIHIMANDGTTVIWEGYVVDFGYNNNRVMYICFESVGFLDETLAQHSSIIKYGTVTSLASNLIIDANNSFTEGEVLNKGVMFTDSGQPAVNVVYPNSNSAFYTAPTETAPSYTYGDYESMQPGSWIGSMGWINTAGHDYAKAANGITMYFTLLHAADVTKIELYFAVRFLNPNYYSQESERPVIEIYDDTNALWRGVSNQNADITGEGYIPDFKGWGNTELILTITANFADYIDGSDQILVRIVSGDPNATATKTTQTKMFISIAKCSETYEALFDTAKGTAYIVDGVTGTTQLDFTGQDPDADQVAATDGYRIGDLIHTVMAALFLASEVRFLKQEIEASGHFDATDYYYSYLGDALRTLAKRDNRYYWQKIGQIFRCYSTYAATGYTLNEANTVENPDNSGWDLSISGKKIYKSVLVAGAGNEAFKRNALIEYPSLISKIITDPSCTTESAAYLRAVQEAAQHDKLGQRLTVIIDYDASDWSDLDIGKTVIVDLYTLVFTGLILDMSHHQKAGEKHLVTMILEDTA